MPRRITPERIVGEAGAELAAAFGSALRTVVVYGSAEHPDFRPERSDVNFAAVAEPVTFAHLQRVAQWYARWRGERVAAPLLLAPSDLTRSLDVFPLEMLDIQTRHRTLAGDELFTDLVVAPAQRPPRMRARGQGQARPAARALSRARGLDRRDPRAHAGLAEDLPARDARPALPARHGVGAARERGRARVRPHVRPRHARLRGARGPARPGRDRAALRATIWTRSKRSPCSPTGRGPMRAARRWRRGSRRVVGVAAPAGSLRSWRSRLGRGRAGAAADADRPRVRLRRRARRRDRSAPHAPASRS